MRWSAHNFRRAAKQRGLSSVATKTAWRFVSQLQEAGLPAVLTLRHLSALTGIHYSELRGVVSRSWVRRSYRSFRIVKRGGGIRRIYVPNQKLQIAQRWLHDNIFKKAPIHSRAFAFRSDRTIVDCASEHCGARWLVKFDMADFFESFVEDQVFRVVADLGYPRLLAFEISRLVTVPVTHLMQTRRKRQRLLLQRRLPQPIFRSSYTIADYDFHERGVLGQGLPTSPVLSNLLCVTLDDALAGVARELGFVYTRYADDLSFSSTEERLSARHISELRRHVVGAMGHHGLRENLKKFSVCGPGARRLVLGLLVDGEKPCLSKASRARVEGHLYYLLKRGPVAHAQYRGFRSVDALREHVTGLLAHVNQVDSDLYLEYLSTFQGIQWPPS